PHRRVAAPRIRPHGVPNAAVAISRTGSSTSTTHARRSREREAIHEEDTARIPRRLDGRGRRPGDARRGGARAGPGLPGRRAGPSAGRLGRAPAPGPGPPASGDLRPARRGLAPWGHPPAAGPPPGGGHRRRPPGRSLEPHLLHRPVARVDGETLPRPDPRLGRRPDLLPSQPRSGP